MRHLPKAPASKRKSTVFSRSRTQLDGTNWLFQNPPNPQRSYERLLRIASLSHRVEEPNSDVQNLVNFRMWTTVSCLCISLYLNLYVYRWIDMETSWWLWCGFVRYSGTLLIWIRRRRRQIDSTRMLMSTHKFLNLWEDTDILYLLRKEGGRGLASIKRKTSAYNLKRKRKKLQNMKMTVILISTVGLETILNGLLRRLKRLKIGEWIEIIQITALLRSAGILRRFQENLGDLLSFRLL